VLMTLVGSEVIYLDSLWISNQKMHAANDQQGALNLQAERHLVDLKAEQPWDIVATDFEDLADRLTGIGLTRLSLLEGKIDYFSREIARRGA